MATGRPADVIAAARKLELQGDLAGDFGLLEQGLAGAGANLEALAELARMAGRLRDPGLALELWANLLAQEPSNLEGLIGRARALDELGRSAEAVAILREAL